MANYLTSFDTYAAYSAATNLDLPNVSLITTTGNVYYKNLFAGASLGDILMWDVTNQKLISTFGGYWDSTTFPIAQYEPIAINVYPASMAPDGKSRFMALMYSSNLSSSGSTNQVKLYWGLDSSSAGQYTSTDKTVLNGRENTTKALTFADGSSANTQAAFAAFYACNIFATNGTTVGDWYLPSYKELTLYASNQGEIDSKIGAIGTAGGNVGTPDQGKRLLTSTEHSANQIYFLSNGSISYESRNSNDIGNGNVVRAMIAL